jgi:Fe-S oxidoreductase
LFELLDATGGGAGSLTAVQQDSIVEGCFDCGLCVLGCPDAPGRTDLAIDVPRLNARARQFRVLRRPPSVGIRMLGGIRRAATSVAAPRSRSRFSTWMRGRASGPAPSLVEAAVASAGRQPGVVLFPTCHVEHHDPAIGRATVGVIERTGTRCVLPEGLVCCGAPQLAAGDLDGFVELGRRNVRVLAESIRAGAEIVVPLPRCAEVLQRDYVAHVGGSDADLVAEHTWEISAHLLGRHARGEIDLREDLLEPPDGRRLAVHAPCAARSMGIGGSATELLRVVGFEVDLVEGCASPDPRRPDEILARTRSAMTEDGSAEAVGTCPSALGAIVSGTTARGRHPVQLLAEAYGLDTD